MFVLMAAGLVGVSPLLTTLPSSAQFTKQGNAYQLRMKFSKGQVLRYNSAITVAAGPQGGAPQKLPFTMRIVDVKGDVATVKVSMTPPGATKPQESEMKMNTRGRLISGPQGVNQMVGAQFPDKPVRVGESWNQKTQAPGPMGNMTINSTNTLRAVRSAGGRQVADVAVRLSGNAGGMRLTGSGTLTYNMADGHMMNATMNQDITITPPKNAQNPNPKPQTMKVRVTITRA